MVKMQVLKTEVVKLRNSSKSEVPVALLVTKAERSVPDCLVVVMKGLAVTNWKSC
jgi:hypothetical protein